MDCQNNFYIDNLDEEEAWHLFKKIAGSCVEGHDLKSLAFDVAKERGGLPIAIVTIAKTLKNKEEYEWKSALQELQHPSFESLEESVATKAYSCIKLSYNHLETEELKSTFLLCCIMVFIYDASVEGLLRYGMGLRLFNTITTMEATRNRVNTLIQRLKKSCLLLDTTEVERFAMYDVVRDVGRSIAQRDRNMFIVKNDLALRDLKKKNTLKNCTSITLLDIAKYPGELDCPQLTFFYMKSKTRLHKVPENFFRGMPNLEVLHLIDMVLSLLPASLGSLKKLRTLYLDWCHLEDIAGIKDMGNLEILVLSSNIELLPKEIGQLTRLKVLKLSNCYDLKVIPPPYISRLIQLEELYLNYKFDNWHVEGLNTERKNASLDELEHLSQPTTLQICIQDAKVVPKGLIFQKLQSYKIYIGVEQLNCYNWYKTSRLLQLNYCYSWYKTDIADANISVDDGVIKQLKGIEELHLNGMQGVKNVLYELKS
ncbi:hypothetical protein LWI28_001541 [Acer negundo]|uniref:NB-ARC domain-containing protein n=1 Tax=Acer negundo TaxID=4023 RepID=A0AAD5IK65_ACENE|nr:hypothetical protein LWI28_001541 [Acer negundo]